MYHTDHFQMRMMSSGPLATTSLRPPVSHPEASGLGLVTVLRASLILISSSGTRLVSRISPLQRISQLCPLSRLHSCSDPVTSSPATLSWTCLLLTQSLPVKWLLRRLDL